MTDKDNSQTGEYSYTYSYSYSKEGGEKNVEVHTGGFSAAAAGEAKRIMEMHRLLSGSNEIGGAKYYVSDTVHGFEELGSLFLSKKIEGDVAKIDIEKY